MENKLIDLVSSFTGLTGIYNNIATIIIAILLIYAFIMCLWSVFKKVGGL